MSTPTDIARDALTCGVFAIADRDRLESALMRWEIENDPPSAGRAFQRQLKEDYTGTLRRYFRLHEDDQRLLAGAYLAYYAQIGGAHPWNSAEGLRLYWKGSLAQNTQTTEAQRCADVES